MIFMNSLTYTALCAMVDKSHMYSQSIDSITDDRTDVKMHIKPRKSGH